MPKIVAFLLASFFVLSLPPFAAAEFTITNVSPTTVNSADDILHITATVSGLTVSPQYLQAAFTLDGRSNYFGITKNLLDEWYSYKSTPALTDLTNYFYTFQLQAKAWSGTVSAKIDTSDKDFAGPGSYKLKLIRYTGNSSSDSNFVYITVNVSSPSAETTGTGTANNTITTAPTPEINFALPGESRLGEEFKISLELKNFDKQADYYGKIRGAYENDTYNKAQTKNNSAYLWDGDSWGKFPLISTNDDGYWKGEVIGRIDPDKPEATYKIKIRLRQKDGETFYESESKEIKMLPLLVAASDDPPEAEINNNTTVIATNHLTSGKEATATSEILLGDILGTASSPTSLPVGSSEALIASKQTNNLFSPGVFLIALGAIILGISGYFLYNKAK